jgi:NADPH:quinone reductase-like Zn-dependent oxidoreductase
MVAGDHEIPARMRALVVKGHEGGARSLELAEVPVPEPGPGEVLIRVACSPVNPNDLLALRGTYEVEKRAGSIAGFEGSGQVVRGAGVMARLLVGRRVAFAAGEGSGAWAEYATASAMRCLPLRGRVGFDEGATLLTNPLTATVLVQRARREGHPAVVNAAAAGALGRMIARLAIREGLPMIHVVRSAAQVEALRALGAEHVLDSTTAGFAADLRARCQRLGATLALDPIAGETTGVLLHALQPGGVVRVYGSLSGAPIQVDASDLLFARKRVEGFTMYEWLETTSLLGQLRVAAAAQANIGGPLATEVRARVTLDAFAEAIDGYERAMSGGKVLFVPNGSGA